MDAVIEPPLFQREKTTLVLGLGNDILGDDAIGLQIIRELRRRLPIGGNIEAVESEEMGLALLDIISGYRKLVLIDSVKTGQAPAGTIHELPLDDVETLPLMAPHFFGIGEILLLGRQLQLPMPDEVSILGIEVTDPFTVTNSMSNALQIELPRLVDAIWKAAVSNG